MYHFQHERLRIPPPAGDGRCWYMPAKTYELVDAFLDSMKPGGGTARREISAVWRQRSAADAGRWWPDKHEDD